MTTNLSKEIGGYFGLDIYSDEYLNLPNHSVALNTARNCLRYLIRTYNIKTVHVPYYTCPVVVEAIEKEDCKTEFYHINESFLPEKTFADDDYIIYTNYFGICAENVKNLSEKYKNLIVDNAQAYHMPKYGIASFNSARKFMGVPDGAFLQCDKLLDEQLEPDKTSIERFSHLLKRVDTNAQFGYADFKNNDDSLRNEGIKLMSNITKALINSHNSETEKKKRLENFNYLHKSLKDSNAITINLDIDDVPMVYPYLVKNGKDLKQKLNNNKIFVATYWNATTLNDIEQDFQDNIVPLPMKALGISANIMSLGAIDFGMIVDGSIVMAENIIHRLGEQHGKMSKLEIIENAVKEMAKPIFFGVLIITVVYMPVLTLEGMEYKMFSPMVFTVCFALLGSLMVAMFLTPVLCSIFLKNDNKDKPSLIVSKVRKPYNDFLEVVMKHRLKTVLVAITLFVVSIFSLFFKGTEFIPSLDEGCFSIGIADLPSISLSEAVKTTTLVEKTLKENIPEVKEVVSKIGRADLATDPMGVYETDMYVNLIPKSKWRFGMNKEKIGIEMDKVLQEKVPGVNFSFTQPIEMRVNELVSGVKSDIAIKLFGEDLDILTKKAEQIESVLQTVKGAVDIQVEQLSGQNQLSIVPDRLAIARYGIDIDDIKTLVTTATLGESVSEILDGKKRFALRVKFSETCRNNDVEYLKHLLVDTEDGRKVPLGQVATVRIDNGIEAVNREFGERRIIIQCNVRGRDIGSFVKDAQSKIDAKIKLPPSYYIQWGGQFENQERAMAKFAVVVPISIAIIFLLLLGTFSSVRDAVLVMFNVPFAAVGGIAALWLRGMYISVPAIIGFIALFGVAILNGLVLISTFNKLQAEGHSMHDVIRLGTATRLRPVLMTAMVAALGFLPMALSTGSGAEVQKPLATVIIGGLISSLFLTLIVLPVLYSLFGDTKVDLKKKFRRIFYKIKVKK